jgi:hypothetical protein
MSQAAQKNLRGYLIIFQNYNFIAILRGQCGSDQGDRNLSTWPSSSRMSVQAADEELLARDALFEVGITRKTCIRDQMEFL